MNNEKLEKLEEKRKELYERVVLALKNQKLDKELEEFILDSAKISFRDVAEFRIDDVIELIDSILKTFDEDEMDGFLKVAKSGNVARELQLLLIEVRERLEKLSPEEMKKVQSDLLS